MKFHKKYPHHLPGVTYFGKRDEIPLRINFSKDLTKPFDDPLHYHKESHQFFVIITGSLVVEVDGTAITLTPEAVLEIEPGTPYRVLDFSDDVSWVVIGTVNDENDRILIQE